MNKTCFECAHANTISLFRTRILNFCMRKHSDYSKDIRNEFTGKYIKTVYYKDTDFDINKKGTCKHFKPLTLWQKIWR